MVRYKCFAIGGLVNSYYQSLLKEIQVRLEDARISEAYDLIHQELSMPYVPSDVLDILQDYEKECLSQMDSKISKVNEEKLWTWIHGNEEQMEKAVFELGSYNLRNYEEEVQALLDSKLLDEFKGELIEALMAQRIDTPYKIRKDGLDITFIPSAILSFDEDKVVLEVKEVLSQWLSNDNPAFYQFCLRLLRQEALEIRPFDFTDLDPYMISKSIVRLVMDGFGQSEEFTAFMHQLGMDEVGQIPLSIERRGENNGN